MELKVRIPIPLCLFNLSSKFKFVFLIFCSWILIFLISGKLLNNTSLSSGARLSPTINLVNSLKLIDQNAIAYPNVHEHFQKVDKFETGPLSNFSGGKSLSLLGEIEETVEKWTSNVRVGFSSEPNLVVTEPITPSHDKSQPDIRDLAYTHPENPDVKGRTFSGLQNHSHILQTYLNSQEVTINDNLRPKLFKPQLLTGLSSNHFIEHKQSIVTAWKHFKNASVVIYDLGLDEDQVEFFKNDTRYIYKKFDFEKYPEHVKYLQNMSFKVLSLMECLISYQICIWFDTSILFKRSAVMLTYKYVLSNKSSFVFYIKSTGHNTAYATHPMMFAYLPSNITRFNQPGNNGLMSQGGAIILLNTQELKHKIMKFAIACALTRECISPPYHLTEDTEYGLKYCNEKYPPTHPFVCHRFDQSLWNILVANCYDFNFKKYRPGKVEVIASPDRKVGRADLIESYLDDSHDVSEEDLKAIYSEI